jgi:hypothetical protein
MSGGYQVDVTAVAGVARSLHARVDDLEGTADGGRRAPDAGDGTGAMNRQLAILTMACGALAGGLRTSADDAAASGQSYDAFDDVVRGVFQPDGARR